MNRRAIVGEEKEVHENNKKKKPKNNVEKVKCEDATETLTNSQNKQKAQQYIEFRAHG